MLIPMTESRVLNAPARAERGSMVTYQAIHQVYVREVNR
jgi:hypothetical protein